MHIIAKCKFVQAAEKHPQYAEAIMETYQILSRGNFTDVHVLKCTFKMLNGFAKTWMPTSLIFQATICG